MDKGYLLHALDRARDYLLTSQDADMWPEEEMAATLIGQLRDEIAEEPEL